MISQTLCKLLQRQTYSCLSHKHGIYFAYSCFVIIVYSAFHFSEELLEFTSHHYEAKFSIYSDNVAGRSFREKLSSVLPIDVVYTWVNGSDPLFLQQLNEMKLQQKDDDFDVMDETCKHENCLILPLLKISSSCNRTLLTSEKFGVFCTEVVGTNSTLLRFPSTTEMNNEKVNLEKTLNTTLDYFHVTTNGKTPESSMLPHAVMLLSIPNTVKSHQDLQQVLIESEDVDFTKVDSFYFDSSKHLAVVWMKDEKSAKTLSYPKEDSKPFVKYQDKRIDVLPLYHVIIKREEVYDMSKSRFEDNEELKYSIRSIMKHAPWIRQIFVVTNGQIPSWMDIRHPRIKLITHDEIFTNKSHLPTFSSPAIESHLHKIPNLADHFIYVNDDVMFGKNVWPDDFYTHTNGYKIYLTWPVPNCAEGCPGNWIKDGYCDASCNTSVCDFDGGDCIGAEIRNGVGINVGGGVVGPLDGGIEGKWKPPTSNNCQPACSNYWLADKFCDQSCNNMECGFDAGDCGIDNYHQLYQISDYYDIINLNGSTLMVANGISVAYMKLNNIFDKVDEASYKTEHGNTTDENSKGEGVRTAVVSNMFNVLTILFIPDASLVKVTVKLTGTTLAQQQQNATKIEETKTTITFQLVANPSAPKENKTIPTTTAITSPENDVIIKNEVTPPQLSVQKDLVGFWSSQAHINLTSLDRDHLPKRTRDQLSQLEHELEDGQLTELGFRRAAIRLLNSTGGGIPTRRNSTNLLRHNDNDVIQLERVDLENKSVIVEINEGKEKLFQHERHLAQFDQHFEPDEVLIHKSRKLLDAFGDSLRYVSNIYNKKYGYAKRRVPAHMPHYIDKKIMTELQRKFPQEFDITSSHQLRHAEDMQFAFSYYYYLMSETKQINFTEYFQQLDTDESGVLSDRELRTLVTRINETPLTLEMLTEMETEIQNCAHILSNSTNHSNLTLKIPDDKVTEVYFETKMPQVTEDLFTNCRYITEKLEEKIGVQNKFKFQEMEQNEVAFKMLKENVSTVVGQLDDIRKNPKKFICLNDNMNHNDENAATVKLVVKELLQSMFPHPSPFELPQEYRNRFQYVKQLEFYQREEQRRSRMLQICALLIAAILFVMTFNLEISCFLRQLKRKICRVFCGNRRRFRRRKFRSAPAVTNNV